MKFKCKENILLTECRFKEGTMVGSNLCRDCEFNVSTDYKKNVVVCSKEGNQAIEPKLIHCTQRHCEDEIHLECRFEDGQKFAAVVIDIDHPEIANKIEKFLNNSHKTRKIKG